VGVGDELNGADRPTYVNLTWLAAYNSFASNDGDGYFETLGDEVTTVPTRTNVNDSGALLIAA
jgi:glycerate-2-kinase